MSEVVDAPDRPATTMPVHAPPPNAPLVSIVMLTYNRGRLLERSLRSLFAQTHRPLQIVVVDDHSRDDTPDVLRALLAEAPEDVEVRVRTHSENLGIGRGRNTGIEAATGTFIAFIDDDCVAAPSWVDELVRPFASDQSIAITGGAIDEPADRTWAQAAAEGINFLGSEERDLRAVVGCNMAFRADFLERRPFDPSVRYGADELDLCFAAARDGLRVRFTPTARVTHHHRRTIGAFLRQQLARGKGSVWVRRKHGTGVWPRKNWIVFALLLACLARPFAPATPGNTTIAVCAALFVAQILVLDRQTGKPLARSLWTLPLVVLGYTAEFLGACREIVLPQKSG